MNHFFEQNPDKKIEDHNLIFFPIFQDEHYYLICINLKKASFEVIDNIRVGKDGNKEYQRYARKLQAQGSKRGTVLFPDEQTTAEKTTTHISVGTCDSKKVKNSGTILFPDDERNAEQKTIEEDAAQKTIVNGSTATYDPKELQT
ncbi:hypothetical protein POM88_031830 [Heracleum sosnowskyi]|uniref:Ubiquitin-like protease family profile domain-containing protein n=1 Tax=Heracleum sosnowskyi TaxID=360622 RepID=A0AAD8HY64_9APIA|nr:hypothetical protein POM88_031830 [Heracleum sosnowskyi]